MCFGVCVSLQIARKRHKVISTFKSPLGQTRPPPPLKHIALMPLSQIRRVLDLQDTEGNTVTACTSETNEVTAHHSISIFFEGVLYSHLYSIVIPKCGYTFLECPCNTVQ